MKEPRPAPDGQAADKVTTGKTKEPMPDAATLRHAIVASPNSLRSGRLLQDQVHAVLLSHAYYGRPVNAGLLDEAPIEAIWTVHTKANPGWMKQKEAEILRSFERTLRSSGFPRIYSFDGKFYWNFEDVLSYGDTHFPEGRSWRELAGNTSAENTIIDDSIGQQEPADELSLPDKPLVMFPGAPSGRSKGEPFLVKFLRANYRRYMKYRRDEVRDFIFRSDRKLYDAIANFERKHTLPPDIAMPNRKERLLTSIQTVVAEGSLDGLSKRQRRSVAGAIKRANRAPT